MSQHYSVLHNSNSSDLLTERVQNIVKMRTFPKEIDTSGMVMVAQTSARNGNEIHEGVEILQQFGMASVPPVNSYGASLCQSGLNDNGFIIATHNPSFHPKGMNTGEVKLYDAYGQAMYFKNNNTIEIDGSQEIDIKINGSTVFSIKNGSVTINADITLNGKMTASGDVVGAGISLSGHKHPGVQAGGATTGAPE
ncbi:phage baseplate assembly protein V [Gluconacetobacter diazotrophicus]|uniref:phage baseplate assembly protein V n=1 Tax=Gluconacetobacter diazotrophicus TaxID=33996 RepID=UPI001648A0F1|nr:phage baseplate assembly protein V [Gluconacetobacter diazotrophicus]